MFSSSISSMYMLMVLMDGSFSSSMVTPTMGSSINAIQYGKLLIEAKLGGLLPRGAPGRGKKNPSPTKGIYGSAAVATYRKVSDHSAKIDDYRAKVTEHNAEIGEDRPDAAEISTAAAVSSRVTPR